VITVTLFFGFLKCLCGTLLLLIISYIANYNISLYAASKGRVLQITKAFAQNTPELKNLTCESFEHEGVDIVYIDLGDLAEDDSSKEALEVGKDSSDEKAYLDKKTPCNGKTSSDDKTLDKKKTRRLQKADERTVADLARREDSARAESGT